MTDTPKVTKGRETVPGVDPRVDTLLGMVMALTSEVSVLRERIDTHECLAAAGKAASNDSVEAFEPGEPDEARRAAARDRLIDKVCRPMIASGEES